MKISYIELLGKKYPLCFSLAATEKLNDAFGSMDKMTEAVTSKNVGEMAKAIDTILAVLMEAGRTYCRVTGQECPEPLDCRPADLIDLTDPTAVNAIYSAMAVGKEREVEVSSKNAETTSGQ